MREAGVGRMLVASLHQGVADVLPARLGFYENWLHVEGLREGTIGLAPVLAVLSFLRQEGAAYEAVMHRAGEYAADWTVDAMRPFPRGLLAAMPAGLRRRLLLRTAGRLVRASAAGSRARVVARGGGLTRVELRGSIFCGVREPVPYPLCGFYAAAYTELLARFGIDRPAVIAGCRGTGAASCLLEIAPSAVQTAETDAEAA